jgi:alpha-galactosidase
LKIQEGLSYLYPLSTISCHVSEAPHAQTLRKTPLETRFNVASFGVLGYELDVRVLKPYERKAVKEQIAFYKKYRDIFQYGKFYRFNRKGNDFQFQVSKDDTHIIGRYQTIVDASPNFEKLYLKNVNEANTYSVYSKPNVLNIDRFGHLIKHAVKVPFKHDGLVMRIIGKYRTLDNAQTKLLVDGAALKNGVPLKQQFMGTYYNTETRLLGDYGSELYVAEKIEVS